MTMQQIDTLATLYAQSLLELAEDAGGREKILELADELEQVSELLAGERDLRTLFSTPVIDEEARAGLIRRIFENRVTDLLLRFMLVLNANDRLGHFDGIQAAYDQMVQDAFGRIEVDVITAIKLDEGTLARISERIQAALGKEPVLHPSIDESIIGGLQLRIGDRLMDGSVATRLRRLGDQLRQNGGHAIRTNMERFMEDAQVASGTQDDIRQSDVEDSA